MRSKVGEILLVTGLVVTLAGALPRKGAGAQSLDLRLRGAYSLACLRLCEESLFQSTDVAIEVFQVLELPINLHEASLVKQEKGGYFLKLSVANSSDSNMLGLRYSLIRIDTRNRARYVANRIEGISLPAYERKTLTFKSPLKFTLKDGERMVLMLEQVVSRESIWEVVKAKEALDSYARGDYSVMPVVLRVANQVDASPSRPIRYFKQ